MDIDGNSSTTGNHGGSVANSSRSTTAIWTQKHEKETLAEKKVRMESFTPLTDVYGVFFVIILFSTCTLS